MTDSPFAAVKFSNIELISELHYTILHYVKTDFIQICSVACYCNLSICSQNSLDNQMMKEQTNADGVQAVLETMVEGEAQLAGDPMALSAPEGAPIENGIIGGNPGEIGETSRFSFTLSI